MKFFLQLTTLLVLFSACRKDQTSSDTLELSMLATSYEHMVRDNFNNFKNHHNNLYQKVQQFGSTLVSTHLTNSRENWKVAYDAYHQLGPFRFHSESTLTPLMSDAELQLSLYVTNPAYIDVTSQDATSGIIPDEATYPQILTQVLTDAHLAGGPENVSLGFHALEFILWGEDNSASGPGNRLVSDFGGTSTNNRRKEYLVTVNYLNNAYVNATDAEAYINAFKKLTYKEQLQTMLSGVYRFVKDDLAGKSIKTPYDMMDQQFEESPYSDNSLNDLKSKLNSTRNFLTGSQFSGTNGYFLIDYIAFKSQDNADKITRLLEDIDSQLTGITVAFDQAVVDPAGRAQLLTVYNKCIDLANAIQQFATEQGISL